MIGVLPVQGAQKPKAPLPPSDLQVSGATQSEPLSRHVL
jgi:hypothetical protein